MLVSWGTAHISRHVLQNVVSHGYVCVKQSVRRCITFCRESAEWHAGASQRQCHNLARDGAISSKSENDCNNLHKSI